MPSLEKSDTICVAPWSKKMMSDVMTIMVIVLNLASHAMIMAVKPRPPAVLVEMVWSTPGNADKTGNTAIAARNEHGAQDNVADVDTGIARCVFRFADYRDLIALFAVF